MALKFEGKFKVGDQIKAYDYFAPKVGSTEKDPYHLVGTVIDECFVHPLERYKAYRVVVTQDNGHGVDQAEYSRVGQIVCVPFQTGFYDDDGEDTADRVQLYGKREETVDTCKDFW